MAHSSDIHASCADTSSAPWFEHYEQGVPGTLEYRNVPLFTWLDEAAEKQPATIACHFYSTKITYEQLQKEAEIVAANLRANNVQPGDRVGIMLPNLPQTMIAFWGILKAGAIVVMINPLYMEKELVHQVHDAGIKQLITIDLCWKKLAHLQDKLNIERYYITTIADGLRFPFNWIHKLKAVRANNRIKIPYAEPHVTPFLHLLEGSTRYSHVIESPETTIALLQYTGGTTGVAKGVMLTHANVGVNIQQVAAVLHCLENNHQTLVAVLPFFHVYGLNTCLLLPVLLRATVVPIPRFAPHELLTILHKYKVTVLPGAPSIYLALLQQKSRKQQHLPHLKFCISGSAPMPLASFKQFEKEFGALLIEGYGLSEASPITHLNPARGQRKVGSIGLPFPDTEARIMDTETGTKVMPTDQLGELVIRGPQVMKGYWNAEEDTATALRDGWLYTGDIATMDNEGYFYIVDRKKDMILVGGYNVCPREIDEVLYEHPKVLEAVAAGIPHPTRGEIIKAYIVLKPGESAEKTEILSWCRERLANYKIPKQVEFRESLPKSYVGKVLRRMLCEEEMKKIYQKNRS